MDLIISLDVQSLVPSRDQYVTDKSDSLRTKVRIQKTSNELANVDSGFLRCTQQMVSRLKSCDKLLTQDLLHRALSDLPVKGTVFGHFSVKLFLSQKSFQFAPYSL